MQLITHNSLTSVRGTCELAKPLQSLSHCFTMTASPGLLPRGMDWLSAAGLLLVLGQQTETEPS